MTVLNRTVFDIPLTWNRSRFESTRNQCRIARKLIETSINAQYEKQMRGIFSRNIEIDENINEINQRLSKCHDKLLLLDNMIELASQSLRIYFDRRMDHVRAIVKEHCDIIQQIIGEEAEHWKEIHAVMNQNLLHPGDLRSRNNNYPRVVQKSPGSNIDTIDEETNELLVNGKTLTPLLTQMIRKSRIQSKRLTLVPSTKANVPLEQGYSVPRKEERVSMHIIPLSTTRQPLQIVDTTFVVKPEETMFEGEMQHDDDEPNGTYRAGNQNFCSHLYVNQPETLLIDSQPNIPTRLCFSPTMLQEATQSSDDNVHERSLSPSSNYSESEHHRGTIKTLLLPIDQNRTHVKQYIEDTRRVGQTFLLDVVKTEQQFDHIQREYIRPTIPDDDVMIINATKQFKSTAEPISHPTNDTQIANGSSENQPQSSTVQETVPVKSRTRATTKTKTKSVIVSARKTRSATKVLAEREATAAVVSAATTAKPSRDKSTENKRKTRKRKQSKSNDRPAKSSDDENEQRRSSSTRDGDTKRKTKRRKKSKSDPRHRDDSDEDDDNNNNIQVNKRRRARKQSKSKQVKDQPEKSNENEHQSTRKKIKNAKESTVQSESENEKTATKHKSTKSSTNDINEEKKSKVKRQKQKTKKSKNDMEQTPQQHSTQSLARK
ncbi:unnamed protein product [Adineta ricciae]|uniref:Uncharacterized protein n=1 Tax=Adineta ricciae TaxID=249248 RepID=A0A813WFR5_ADIRI|nr:unnamed protein product [Adineta ricciae]